MTKRPVNILVLGKEGVGKTALVVRFLTGRFLTEYAHLDEVTYERTITVDDRSIVVRVTDVGGRILENKTSSKDNLQKIDGAVIVYSIEDFRSFHVAEELVSCLKRDRKCQNGMPIIMLGNKHDLEHSREVPRHITTDADWQRDSYLISECSASSDAEEITKIFHKLIRKICEKREGSGKSQRKLSATTIGSPKLIRNHLKRRFSMFTRERTSTM